MILEGIMLMRGAGRSCFIAGDGRQYECGRKLSGAELRRLKGKGQLLAHLQVLGLHGKGPTGCKHVRHPGDVRGESYTASLVSCVELALLA